MVFEHNPVMLNECLEYLRIRPNGTYIDCTVGGAGHSSMILSKLYSNGFLLGIDRDESAVKASGERLKQVDSKADFLVVQGNYSDIDAISAEHDIKSADGILLDLGVSSYQLDEPERGFSYMHDAPIDMRMDRAGRLSAAEIVNRYDERELANIIRSYGEERWASRIAAFIVEKRKSGSIETTGQLVEIIKAAIPASARREGPHPAKRTFQALRIAVNDELGALETVIDKGVELLKTGGRMCIITFHSLEDRIVKTKFRQLADPCVCPDEFPVCVCGKVAVTRNVTKKPVIPTNYEIEHNPRSRSAKLRILEKV
ncbi:MAG: 16S rRNA (cytosine(1402)-N(4))-methyltransferase RsmH [Eubacteriales bacterium]|nr:16S rRNA (cytosine(1402)-N(4))-methyltransferase RsmH [Eubacteriales bacterium]